MVGFYGNNQIPGAHRGAGHTAHAQVLVHPGHSVDHLDGAVLAHLGAGAVAQAAELAGQGAAAAHLGGSQAVLEALVICLGLGALGQVAVGVVELFAGAADQSHLPGDLHGLHTHDGGHGLGAFVAAGSALADGGLAVEDGLGVSAAAGIAAAAAVGAGETFIQLIQPGVGFHIENLGGGSQNQTENQAQAAQNCNRNDNFHLHVLLRKSAGRRSP